jgi:hypothetical protein
MGFHVVHRWGALEREPTVEWMREVLAELDLDDVEHQSVSLTHDIDLLTRYAYIR